MFPRDGTSPRNWVGCLTSRVCLGFQGLTMSRRVVPTRYAVRSAVVLSDLDAGFEPRCPHEEFSCVCCLLLLLLLLLAKMCCSPLDPKKGCKTSTG